MPGGFTRSSRLAIHVGGEIGYGFNDPTVPNPMGTTTFGDVPPDARKKLQSATVAGMFRKTDFCCF